MPDSPALVDAPAVLWRVERTEPALRFSRINAVDVRSPSGNRFDVVGAGVLYAASRPEGGIAETVARFRAPASLVAKLAQPEYEGLLDGDPPGTILAEWRQKQVLRSFELNGALPFVDIESPLTHTYLTRSAPSVLLEHGVETLDVATVRGPDRFLTRDLGSWIYARTDEHGRPLYSGVRYMSKLGDWECWAIFDGTAARVLNERALDANDSALVTVAELFGLTVK